MPSLNATKIASLLENALFYAVLFALIVSPLPLGSNRGWAWLALAGFGLLLLAILLLTKAAQALSQPIIFPQAINSHHWLIALLALWMWLQASFVLPDKMLSILSPATANIKQQTAHILAMPDVDVIKTISLDAGQTLDKALVTLGCFAIIFVMHQVISNRQRLVVLCYAVVFSGVFQALYGVMMTLTGVEYLFFIPKESYIGNATGTFVNRNHLAGYLELTLSLGIGLMLALAPKRQEEPRHWRSLLRKVLQITFSQVGLIRGMLIVMVTGLIMTHSRMGNAAFFNALLITGGLAITSSKQFRRPGFYFLLISIFIVDILILGSVFDLEKVVQRLETTTLEHESRDEVVDTALRMVPDFWLLGSGAGTFAYVFPNYVEQYIGVFYDFAHNDYLQIFLELGLLGCLPLVSYFVFSMYKAYYLLRNGNSRVQNGVGFAVVMGGISLLIHSSVDFNLQIPANILLFVALLSLPDIVLRIEPRVS